MSERDQLLADVYDELRRVAARMMRRDAPELTLRPTELVNEAAMRVMKLDHIAWADRRHMFAISARVLRQTMIDEIRSRNRLKRRKPDITVMLDDLGESVELERLTAALGDLEQISPELSGIVDLRFFVGLTIEEIAAATGQSERTVKRRWQAAKAWLATTLVEDA